jgi:hypothetical protein
MYGLMFVYMYIISINIISNMCVIMIMYNNVHVCGICNEVYVVYVCAWYVPVYL